MKIPLMKNPGGVGMTIRPPRRPARPPTVRAATAPSKPSTKGKSLGQHAFIGRAAQGQRGGGMRALGVFENWAGK